jgi:nucleoside phosphorylase
MANKNLDPYGETKRNRDLTTIRELFSVFPRPLVDHVLEEALSDRILTDHIDCLMSAEQFFRSTIFHLYDQTLRQLLDDIFNNWNLAWDVGRFSHYDHLHRGVATLNISDTDSAERWEKHDAYIKHVRHARQAMAKLTVHLHDTFPDFDLAESDRIASEKYWEMVRSVEQRMNEMFDKSDLDRSESTNDEQSQAAAEEIEDATDEFLVKVGDLKGLLNERARNGTPSEREYAKLRAELIAIPEIRDALPKFVLSCKTIQDFWELIKAKYSTWNERTEFLQREFKSVLVLLGDVPAPTKSPDGAQLRLRPDVLVVTVNEHETRAVYKAFFDATKMEAVPVSIEGRLYHDLGMINDTRVFHALSEMGSGSLGAMQQTVDKAIRALDPSAVIAVGIAFGADKGKQNIGEVLVSKQLRPYELQRTGEQIILRDDKPHATARLINHFELFAQTEKWTVAKVRSGVMLSGEKLVDDVNYRDQLLELENEAVGGEMEGAGLYVSCQEHKVDWIVIKAICDWADGGKGYRKESRQKQAALNAANFVVESLKYTPLKRND